MGEFSSTGLTSSAGPPTEQVPAGMYQARCFQIIDLGVQETPFKDDDGIQKNALQVRFVWEILDPTVKREDGKPFVVSRDFTNSLHEKSSLLPFLESWRGKPFTAEELQGFELAKVLGSYCQLQVQLKKSEKTGREFPKVTAIVPLTMKDKPEAINPNVAFSLAEWDQEVFESLPRFTQEKIKDSLTYRYEMEGQKQEPAADPAKKKQKDDVVIEDIGDDPINLDDIPF